MEQSMKNDMEPGVATIFGAGRGFDVAGRRGNEGIDKEMDG